MSPLICSSRVSFYLDTRAKEGRSKTPRISEGALHWPPLSSGPNHGKRSSAVAKRREMHGRRSPLAVCRCYLSQCYFDEFHLYLLLTVIVVDEDIGMVDITNTVIIVVIIRVMLHSIVFVAFSLCWHHTSHRPSRFCGRRIQIDLLHKLSSRIGSGSPGVCLICSTRILAVFANPEYHLDHAGTSFYWDPYQDRAQRMCRQDLHESCLEVRGTSEKTC